VYVHFDLCSELCWLYCTGPRLQSDKSFCGAARAKKRQQKFCCERSGTMKGVTQGSRRFSAMSGLEMQNWSTHEGSDLLAGIRWLCNHYGMIRNKNVCPGFAPGSFFLVVSIIDLCLFGRI
jgi:hypothetical protein